MAEQDLKDVFRQKRYRTSSFASGVSLMFSDALFVMLSIGASFFIINLINHHWINFRSFVEYAVYLPPTLAVFYVAGLYPGISMPPGEEIKKFSICVFFVFAGIALSITVEEADDKVPLVVAFLLATPIASLALPVGREAVRHFLAHRRWFGVPAVVYVNGDSGNFIITRLQERPDLGYRPALIIDSSASKPSTFSGVPVLPSAEETMEFVRQTGIKVAIVSGYARDTTDIDMHYRYTITFPRRRDNTTITTSVRDFGGILGFSSTHNLTKNAARFLKRFVDVTLVILSAPLTIPLTLVVALAIKATSPGPVFYGHGRIGKNGRLFKCWKFRSMVIDADKQLERILAENPKMRAEWEKDRKLTDDPRITKVGRFLRKTSIDEIPQFFNILTGEMSFIGPRPVTEPELTRYGDKSRIVLSVRPGLSGMWQISGRSDTGYEDRIMLDSYYIQNWSVWLDLWIIIKTIHVVLKGKGAY